MAETGYLVGFSVLTWGQDGENLGSDEAEIVALAWAVFNARTSTIEALTTSLVQPRDLGKVNWESLKEKGITEPELRAAPPLHDVLGQFEMLSSKLRADGSGLAVLTDGQLPLRQALHPEASKKDISLTPTYWSFFDVRKEFRRLLPEAGAENLGTLADILSGLGMEREATGGVVGEAKDLVTVAGRLVQEAGLKGVGVFQSPDLVQTRLLSGVCQREEEVDGNTIVRARGLPWQSSDQDVAKFFVGLNIAKGGVALCLSSAGRRNGEALVRFEEVAQRDMALRRHRHFMGNRYIEIYRAAADDFLSVAAGDNDEVQKFLAKEAPVIIRMRGLPYDSTPQQIIEFFQREDGERIDVIDGDEGILFVNRADGRATGDAFVLLSSEEDCVKATNRQKQYIGTRYIELFRTTTAEVQQVINNSMESGGKGVEMTPSGTPGLALPLGAHPGLISQPSMQGLQAQMPSPAVLQHQLLIQGRSRDCIRLRGLPYEAQVQNILDFLGEFAKHIVYQGVHMVFNAQGQASGEAFIQMDTEAAAHSCAEERHNKYMQIGRKQRYIEVFQCSADDMNLVLTGPGSGAANGGGLVHPGLALSPGSQFASPPPLGAAQFAFAANPAMAQAILQAQHSQMMAQMAAQQRLMCPVSMGHTPVSLASPTNASHQHLLSPLQAQQLIMAQNAALMQAGNNGGFGHGQGQLGGSGRSALPLIPGYPSPSVTPPPGAFVFPPHYPYQISPI